MTANHEDGSASGGRQSMRDILARLETGEESEGGSSDLDPATGRVPLQIAVVAPSRASSDGLSRFGGAVTPDGEATLRTVASEQAMWGMRPAELDPANLRAVVPVDESVSAVVPRLRGGHGSIAVLAGLGVIVALATTIACAYVVIDTLRTPALPGSKSAATRPIQPLAATFTADAANETLAPTPIPVPARRPAALTTAVPASQPAGIEFDHDIVAVPHVAVAVPLHVNAALLASVDAYYVTIGGLPEGAALSRGRPVYPGIWAIEQTEVYDLRLTLPDGAPAATTVDLTLVARPGRVLAAGQGVIRLQDATAAGQPDTPSGKLSQLVTRGVALLASGSAAAARVVFQAGATSGDADAAFFLAMTYDPGYARQLGLEAPEADLARARQWYETAAAGGSTDAAARLKQLSPK